MDTWHDRLQFALLLRKKTYADLVRITRLAKPSVYAWKPTANKRTEMMDGNNAALVCEALNISPLWLFHNRGPGPETMASTVLQAQTDRSDYLVGTWPFAPADAKAYYALPDEARGWVKCMIARAIEDATAKYGGNNHRTAA